MSHELDGHGLDATEKAGTEAALNRCRALAAQIASELRNRRPELFVDKLALADFYAALKRQMSLKSRLRLCQLAFPRNPLMLFICTFDAVFIFAAVVRELFRTYLKIADCCRSDINVE
jgi:hypothetical protein